jgi:hypothetical protein
LQRGGHGRADGRHAEVDGAPGCPDGFDGLSDLVPVGLAELAEVVFGMRLKVLEDEPDRGGADLGEVRLACPGQVTPVELDGAAGGPVQATAEELEQGGLAVPGAALDGEPFALADGQGDVLDRGDGAAARCGRSW